MDWCKATHGARPGHHRAHQAAGALCRGHGLLHPHALPVGRDGAGAHLHALADVDPAARRRLPGAGRRALHLRHRRRSCAACARRWTTWTGAEASAAPGLRLDADAGGRGQRAAEDALDRAVDRHRQRPDPHLRAAAAGAGRQAAGREGIRGGGALRAGLLQAAAGAGAVQPPVALPRLRDGGAHRDGRDGPGAPGHGRRGARAARRRQHPGLPGRGVGVLHRHGAVRHRLVRAGRQGARRPRHRLPGEDPEPVGRLLRQLRQGRQVHRRRRDQLGRQVLPRRLAAEADVEEWTSPHDGGRPC